MKKAIFLLLLIPLNLFSQKSNYDCGKNTYHRIINPAYHYPMNTLYASFEETDLGYGLSYDRRIIDRIGLYTSLLRGKYWIPGTTEYINHNEIVLGLIRYMPMWEIIENSFTLGFSYHNLKNVPNWLYDVYNSGTAHYRLQHLSFELGCRMRIGRWFTSGFRFDFLRDEGKIDMGFSF